MSLHLGTNCHFCKNWNYLWLNATICFNDMSHFNKLLQYLIKHFFFLWTSCYTLSYFVTKRYIYFLFTAKFIIKLPQYLCVIKLTVAPSPSQSVPVTFKTEAGLQFRRVLACFKQWKRQRRLHCWGARVSSFRFLRFKVKLAKEESLGEKQLLRNE